MLGLSSGIMSGRIYKNIGEISDQKAALWTYGKHQKVVRWLIWPYRVIRKICQMAINLFIYYQLLVFLIFTSIVPLSFYTENWPTEWQVTHVTTTLHQQVIGINMGISSAHLLVNLALMMHEYQFMGKVEKGHYSSSNTVKPQF